MTEISIRRAAVQDIPYFYDVCLKTGDAGKDATKLFNDPFIVGMYFVAPYLVYPDSICFAADYNNKPQGYIVAVPDTLKFNCWMEDIWLPPLRERCPQHVVPQLALSEDERKIYSLLHNNHIESNNNGNSMQADYPAHLHINLLPGIQGKGIGRSLIISVLAELGKSGIPGVHLGVNARNTGAIEFYKKMGFKILSEEEWGLKMGRRC